MKLFNYIAIHIIVLGSFIGMGYGIYVLYHLRHWITMSFFILLYILTCICLLMFFTKKHNVASKIFWTLMIIFCPIVGWILFLLLGCRYSKSISLSEYRKNINFQFEDLQNDVQITNKNVRELFNKQSQCSSRGIYLGNFDFLSKGDEIFETLFGDLKKAKKFIHLQYYIIKPGEIFEEFKAILLERASQGVEIRIIIDDFGRFALPYHELQNFKQNGIEVAIFGKIHFPFMGSESWYRLHRKTVIIDGQIVHTGGINIADEYSNLNPKYGLWLDNHTRIVGKATRSYSLLFIQDWAFITKEMLDYPKYLLESNFGKSISILVEDSPEIDFPLLQNALVMWIQKAKKTISLATPYLVPDKAIVAALKKAALNGIEVKIYFPGQADKHFVYLVTKYWVNELIQFNIQFYQTKDIFLHSKMGIFDNEYAYFGTMNIDMRSFYFQLETLNLVSGPIIQDIQKVFNDYQKMSQKIEPTHFQLNGYKRRLLAIYVSIFSLFM